MRVAIVTDVFPPLRSSGAVQLRDLALEFVRQGHCVTVMVAAPQLVTPWSLEAWCGVNVLRLRTPRSKDVGYIRRTWGEFYMPFAMLRNMRTSPVGLSGWDGVVWYSPTIFLGPVVAAIKRHSGCRGYLIIRDIFPEWAVDMGIIGRGLPYFLFRLVARYQYGLANVIGIQSPGNAVYFRGTPSGEKRIEVLQNWLACAPAEHCRISVVDTRLAGRKIFVYAGNMGIAQGMDILLALAERLRSRDDIGFLFVGRGTDAQRLREDAVRLGLDNVMFHEEIAPEEVAGLYAQCHVGLVALDPRHKTHNIPGKFLSYMQAGLPVLARINAGNDLVSLIEAEQVGKVSTSLEVEELVCGAELLLLQLARDALLPQRCMALAARLFSPEAAVYQVVSGLQK